MRQNMLRSKWSLKSTGPQGNSRKLVLMEKILISQINHRLHTFCLLYMKKKNKWQQNIRYAYSGLLRIITNCLFSLPISYHHSSFQIFIQLLHWCDFTSRCSFKQKRLSRLSLLYILALASWIYYFLPKFLCIRVWLAARFSVQHNP